MMEKEELLLFEVQTNICHNHTTPSFLMTCRVRTKCNTTGATTEAGTDCLFYQTTRVCLYYQKFKPTFVVITIPPFLMTRRVRIKCNTTDATRERGTAYFIRPLEFVMFPFIFRPLYYVSFDLRLLGIFNLF